METSFFSECPKHSLRNTNQDISYAFYHTFKVNYEYFKFVYYLYILKYSFCLPVFKFPVLAQLLNVNF